MKFVILIFLFAAICFADSPVDTVHFCVSYKKNVPELFLKRMSIKNFRDGGIWITTWIVIRTNGVALSIAILLKLIFLKNGGVFLNFRRPELMSVRIKKVIL